MQPKTTLYKLASTQKDKELCRALWGKYKRVVPLGKLGWPTVMAVRGGKILGFLSTHSSNRAVIAGPIIVDKDHGGIVTMRLVEAYENVLRAAGVGGYYFSINEKKETWIRIVKDALGLEPYGIEGGELWFRRDLNGRRTENQLSGA